ncbi:lipoprotein precursor [Paraconexibacter sp. AEG42_29]|uniref:Lipoprotein n=1 Tax=Paraconexibacter sp. AEG42_29 TaxID=2997339 RepID=A0AAU7AV89_9ACTN
MRPTNMSRARLTAGATAVCATLAVVPTTGAADTTRAASSAKATGGAAKQQTKRERKRTQASVWVQQVGRNVTIGRTTSVRGKLQPSLRGRVVRLQVRRGNGWSTVDRTLTRQGGRFSFAYKPQRPGVLTLRVQFPGDQFDKRTARAAGRMNVFRRAYASWYALYGNPLACGGTLGYNELGVAHKTLPCGTKLTLRYRGKSVRVRVIDRGPFVGGREFDLTGATKRALGFGDLGTVLATK